VEGAVELDIELIGVAMNDRSAAQEFGSRFANSERGASPKSMKEETKEVAERVGFEPTYEVTESPQALAYLSNLQRHYIRDVPQNPLRYPLLPTDFANATRLGQSPQVVLIELCA
jgi:hypothetical protein